MSDLQNLTPANTYKGLLQVGDYTNGVDSTVKAVLDGEGTTSALAIGTTKVGINTTSPTQELDVSGNVVADEYALDQTGTSSSAVAIHAPATNELAIRTNSTEAMRIDSSGKVGIGVTSPSTKLEINSGVNDSCLHLKSTDPFVDLKMSDDTTTDGGIRVSNKGDDLLLQRVGGNVGIGTEDPDAKMDIKDGHILVKQSTNTTQENILLQGSGYELNGILYGNVSIRSNYNNATNAGSLNFYSASSSTNTTERMRIDSNGNVGIGTTSPSAPLEVSSTTGGVIMPRMTTTQMNAISSPTDGEMIYNTTENKFYGRANGAWTALH